MQKSIFAAMGALAFGLAGIASASAATVDLGTFSDDNTLNFPGFTYAANATIDQTYQFTLAETADLSLSITNSFAKVGQQISGLTLTFEGVTGLTRTDYINPPANTLGSTTAAFGTLLPLGSGTYTFNVSGTAGVDGSSYIGNLAVSAVPLPASAPLFGAALLALAGLGYGMNRRGASNGKKAAAAA